MASTYITCSYIGELIGATLIGLALRVVHVHAFHVLLLVSLAVTTFGVPWCRDFNLMATMQVLSGMITGFIYALAFVEMMRVWGSTTQVPVYAMSFSYSIGSLLVSFFFLLFQNIARTPRHGGGHNVSQWKNITSDPVINYLSPVVNPETEHVWTLSDNQTSIKWENTTSGQMDVSLTMAGDVSLVWTYTVCSAALLILALCVAAFHITINWKDEAVEMHGEKPATNEGHARFRKCMFIVCLVIYLLNFCLNLPFYSFFPVFNVKWMNWSKDNAIFAVSIYRAFVIFSRFLALFISIYISAFKILLSCGIMVNFILVIFILNGLVLKSDALMFPLSAAFGLFYAPISASVVNVLEKRVVNVRYKTFAILSVCSSIGPVTISPFVAYLIDTFSPMCLFYVLFTTSVSLLSFAIILICFVSIGKEKDGK
ncbi:uncharacterized protein [Argopecten irradians]|uniref:uncharacterized protein n=1 Tax=Argopecten irradians TaxID=31199 RepID=UPI003711D6F4